MSDRDSDIDFGPTLTWLLKLTTLRVPIEYNINALIFDDFCG